MSVSKYYKKKDLVCRKCGNLHYGDCAVMTPPTTQTEWKRTHVHPACTNSACKRQDRDGCCGKCVEWELFMQTGMEKCNCKLFKKFGTHHSQCNVSAPQDWELEIEDIRNLYPHLEHHLNRLTVIFRSEITKAIEAERERIRLHFIQEWENDNNTIDVIDIILYLTTLTKEEKV